MGGYQHEKNKQNMIHNITSCRDTLHSPMYTLLVYIHIRSSLSMGKAWKIIEQKKEKYGLLQTARATPLQGLNTKVMFKLTKINVVFPQRFTPEQE